MKKLAFFLFVSFSFMQLQAQTSIFNNLLETHVSKQGLVNYKNFKADEAKLNTYISYLEKTKPTSSWSVAKQKAFLDKCL